MNNETTVVNPKEEVVETSKGSSFLTGLWHFTLFCIFMVGVLNIIEYTLKNVLEYYHFVELPAKYSPVVEKILGDYTDKSDLKISLYLPQNKKNLGEWSGVSCIVTKSAPNVETECFETDFSSSEPKISVQTWEMQNSPYF